ncbi:MAG: helix-turn-helix domain-containing protein [Kiloniellaceae bacterium]
MSARSLYPADKLPATIPRRSLAEIKATVCRRWSISPEDLVSHRRAPPLVAARFAAMYLARLFTPHSSSTIGLHFGDRDHTTVLHAWSRMDQAVLDDADAAEAIAEMVVELCARPAPDPGQPNASSPPSSSDPVIDLAARYAGGATPIGSVTADVRALAEEVLRARQSLRLIAHLPDRGRLEDARAIARSSLEGEGT